MQFSARVALVVPVHLSHHHPLHLHHLHPLHHRRYLLPPLRHLRHQNRRVVLQDCRQALPTLIAYVRDHHPPAAVPVAPPQQQPRQQLQLLRPPPPQHAMVL